MFGTKLGAADNAMDFILSPETAQGIFVNFLNVQKHLDINCLWDCSNWKSFLEMRLLQDNLF